MSANNTRESWEDFEDTELTKHFNYSSTLDNLSLSALSLVHNTNTTNTTNNININNNNNNNNNETETTKDEENEDNDEDEDSNFNLMIIINYTKLTNGKITGTGEDDEKELIEELEAEIHKDFENETEKLFNANVAFHTDSDNWTKDLDKLENLFPGKDFSFMDYPHTIENRDGEKEYIDLLWKYIKEPTPWECVNIIKCEYLPIANRGAFYKYEMANSIKYLAMEQKELGKLAVAMKKQEDDQGTAPPMNVLDQIMAMVFSRLTIYGNEEEHFKTLATVHERVREGWIKEFGCLPPDMLWKGTRIVN